MVSKQEEVKELVQELKGEYHQEEVKGSLVEKICRELSREVDYEEQIGKAVQGNNARIEEHALIIMKYQLLMTAQKRVRKRRLQMPEIWSLKLSVTRLR
ncbi:3282_t:CDS:2 [Acaulospora morrowiae]|uniref:3282_t:CDS:1 n=1 Tax=Acaulospora morrowiae TaxID=94023 RepID=A0A9N9BNJ4_9GLOM|nr:3282_t:CDS:2 [Acaulospora morrowiae]